MIYHLIARTTWEQTLPGPYHADSLAMEGFIHCSYQHKVAWAANKFHSTQSDLLVLGIDSDRLKSPVRAEDPGCGELFPHIYGPIDRDAVVQVQTMQRGSDGQWVFPAEPAS
jgi:uncharacterized protein (DUF952 family)